MTLNICVLNGLISSVERVDINSSDVWRKKYKYDIPVIHVNNEYLCKHSLDKQRLLDKFENLGVQSKI